MSEDVLGSYSVQQVAAWYGRLAEGWQRSTPELRPSLAAEFLKAWLNNRSHSAKIYFEAPTHLKSNGAVQSVQAHHRRVFITDDKARSTGGRERWAGVLPRLQGAPGFTRWSGPSPLSLEYESLCDPAPNIVAIARVQTSGTSGDRDVFGSLRGFQLKSSVVLTAAQAQGSLVTVSFKSWTCSGADRYDWNYSEHLTVANPDYQSKADGAIAPNEQTITVYHRNAKRLEDANLAAPYDVVIKPWQVTDPLLLKDAVVDSSRRI